MNAKHWGTSLSALFLALLLSFGGMGCLISGFSLEAAPTLALFWAGAALMGVLVLRWKHGSLALVGLLAFSGGYIVRRGIAAEQLFSLIYRLSRVYDSAYGWGALRPGGAASPDLPTNWPLGIWGCVTALYTVWRLCRRKSGWPAVFPALVPLLACMVVTDTVPHAIPLLMLMLGILLLLLTDAVRQENEQQGLRLTAMAFLPVTLALLAVFLLWPQETYVNRSEEFRRELLQKVEALPELVETRTRQLLSELQGESPRQIDLTAVGPMDTDTFPVLEVSGDARGNLYLRGQDFDSYSGKGWASSGQRQEDFSLVGDAAGAVTIRTRSRRSLYYAPYYPAEEWILTGGKRENPGKEQEYSFSLAALPDSWRLTAAGMDPKGEEIPLSAGEEELYLALPESTRRAVSPLLEGLPAGTNTEKADFIAALVCDSAPYDRATPAMPEGEADFAVWFLQRADRGYCVHFATAAAVLLRAAGVPSRYVTGYMVELSPNGTATATGEDAHAWAEYYEPLLGTWLVLEATPADLTEEGPAITRPVSLPETAPPTAEATRPAITEPKATAPVLPEPDPVKLSLFAKVLIFLAAALAINEIQHSTRLRLRRHRQKTGTSNAQALARWRETELLCRLLKESPDQRLLELAQKAAYSAHDLTEEELMEFDSHNRLCLRRLRSRNFVRRLIYQYIYAIF